VEVVYENVWRRNLFVWELERLERLVEVLGVCVLSNVEDCWWWRPEEGGGVYG